MSTWSAGKGYGKKAGDWRKGKGGDKGRGGGGYGSDGKSSGGKGAAGKSAGKGRGGNKPTDDPNFVRWSQGMKLRGSESGTVYVVEAYVASGSFSRVFRVRAERPTGAEVSTKRRWSSAAGGPATANGAAAGVFAAKVMRKHDAYIQYTSDGPKEGELLRRLEQAQREAGEEVRTMRCFDSFATTDDAGEEYWCLILEWLDCSLFDVVRANGNRGLHLSMVRIMLRQLVEQLKVLQNLKCTHTDIKHKNCCLADTEHFMAPGERGRPEVILTNPEAKFIDYGNAVFEGEEKTHPIHTKQFRAPEVLLNIREGWSPPSDTWTLGITAAFIVSGQLIFNSHEPDELIHLMVKALGPFPERLLDAAKDARARRAAEKAAAKFQADAEPQLGAWLGISPSAKTTSPEGACLDLIRRMLELDPLQRISATDALRHPFLAPDGIGSAAAAPSRPAGAALTKLSAPR